MALCWADCLQPIAATSEAAALSGVRSAMRAAPGRTSVGDACKTAVQMHSYIESLGAPIFSLSDLAFTGPLNEHEEGARRKWHEFLLLKTTKTSLKPWRHYSKARVTKLVR